MSGQENNELPPHIRAESERMTDIAWQIATKRSTDHALEFRQELIDRLPGITIDGLTALEVGSHLMQAVATIIYRQFPSMPTKQQSAIGNEIKNKLADVLQAEIAEVRRRMN